MVTRSSSNATSPTREQPASTIVTRSSKKNSANARQQAAAASTNVHPSNWKKLKGKLKQTVTSSTAPQGSSAQTANPVFRTRIVDAGAKLLALSALGEASGDYKLGGERLRLSATVAPSMALPKEIYLDNALQTSITFGRGSEANVKIDSTR